MPEKQLMRKIHCPFRKDPDDCLTSSCGCWNFNTHACGLIQFDQGVGDLQEYLKSITDQLSNIHGAIKGER